jgi:hypothetical protein
VQQLGRVLRPWPAPEMTPGPGDYMKGSAQILDFVDSSGRHSLISLPTLFGLRGMNLKGKKVTEVLEEIEQLELKFPGIDVRGCASIDEARVTVETVNLFQPACIPAIVRKLSRFAWMGEGESAYRLSLPDRTTLIIRENHLGNAEIWRADRGTRAVIETHRNLQEAFCAADQLVPSSQIGAVMSTARWRNDPPTEAQAYALYRWDRSLRSGFKAPKDLFEFIYKQYELGVVAFTKGGISAKLSALMPTRR